MKQFIEWHSNAFKAGDKFGKLTILKTVRPPNTYRYHALCQCECGKQKYIRVDALRSGHTISCGCAQLESATKHGLFHHPFLLIHTHMMSRCYNPKDKRYSSYGAEVLPSVIVGITSLTSYKTWNQRTKKVLQ